MIERGLPNFSVAKAFVFALALVFAGLLQNGAEGYCQQPAPSSGPAASAIFSPPRSTLTSEDRGALATPPASLTGAFLEQKVVELVKLHGGYINPDEVLRVMSAKFRHVKKFDTGYGAELDINGSPFNGINYAQFSKSEKAEGSAVSDGGPSSILNVDLPYRSNDRSQCIKPLRLKTILLSQGWQEINIGPSPNQPYDFYTSNGFSFINPKNKSQINVSFADGKNMEVKDIAASCATSINIRGRP